MKKKKQSPFNYLYEFPQTGDEMSKRSKFLLVTWVGTEVSPIKKAKMSTDKALVKEILSNFAVELTLESSNELDHEAFLQELRKAGGANYGTGIRD
ncbi:Coactosin-like protein-like [Homarus americanus]|uniref:Coactosin-like protein n=1 Tax=Homarus americanus TaxID=6706 RepID=A0A8J5TT19_HOMAM|nr:Coactosin-like protein-like [Homarus americanus]